MSLLIGFAGQGLQHEKMFRLLKTTDAGVQWLTQASTMLGKDLLDDAAVNVCCQDVMLAQIMIVLLSVGLFRCADLKPTMLCGYSLGDVSAFCVSAQLELPDIIELIKKRAELMSIAAKEAYFEPSGLAALKGNVSFAIAQQLAQSHQCYLAIINAGDHYIVGGADRNLTMLLQEATNQGVKTAEKLAVHLPSHTPLLAGAVKPFLAYLNSQFLQKTLSFPVLNTLTNMLITETDDLLTVLANELANTLHWDRTMSIASEYGITQFLELGPDASLKNMFWQAYPDISGYSSSEFSTLSGIGTSGISGPKVS